MKPIILTIALLLGLSGYASQFYLYNNQVFSENQEASFQYYNYDYSRDHKLKRQNLQVTLYKVPEPTKFFSERVLNQSSLNMADDEVKKMKFIKTWQESLDGSGQYYYRSINLGKLATGVYIAEGIVSGEVSRIPIIITNYSIITKSLSDNVIGFVTDNQLGQEQMGFQFIAYQGDKVVNPAAINGSLAKFTVPQEQRSNYNYPIIALRGNDLAVSNGYYYQYYYNQTPGIKKFIFTDRSAYRPEQKVQFKGIVRKKNGFNYDVVQDSVYYTVTDPQNNEVYKGRAKLDSDGSFVDSLQLEPTFKLGQYKITANLVNMPANNGWWWGYTTNECTFLVEEYKKPEFDVKVKMDKPQYVNGEKIKATITADYFFGAPVTNAEVEYKIMKEQYHVPWYYNYPYYWWYEEWYGGYYTSNKQIVHTGTGKIGPDGEFEIEYETGEADKLNYKYTVIAEVRDASRRTIDGNSTAMVAYSEYNLSCNAGKYYYKPEETVDINISATDLARNPVSAEVKVRVYKDGRKEAKHLIKELAATTNALTGTVEASFNMKDAGYYYVDVIGEDSRGKETTTSCNVYVLKEKDYRYNWWGANHGNVKIITDKKVYMAGEKVKAMIYIPHEADALITLNGNELANYTVYSFKQGSDSIQGVIREIEFELNPEAYGKVEVALGYMNNGNFYQKREQLTVIPDNKYLNVEIEFTEEEYKPGTMATGTLKITDSKGRPVPDANLSLSTADESIYFLYPDQSKDIKKVFYDSEQINTQFAYQGNIYQQMNSVMIKPEEMKWRAEKFNIDFERWNYLSKNQWHRIIYESRSSEDLPRVNGYAVDFRTGEVIPGVKVKCGKQMVMTDENGFYSIDGLDKTYVTVKFSYNGKTTTIENISTSTWSDIGLSAAISSSKNKTVKLVESPEIYTYSWMAADSTSVSSTSGLATGTYAITVTDANGATVNGQIAANFIASDTKNTAGELFFTSSREEVDALADGTTEVTASGGAAGYRWDFGEGMDKRLSVIGETGAERGRYKTEMKTVEARIRSEFKDAIYWNPNLRTNANGKATIKLRLPDNLTTWRTTAKVITKDGKVGQGLAKITVKKNLLVRMETPRFMKVGDELLVATNIHNYLSTDKKVKVHLMSDGVAVFGTEQYIMVEANGEKRIDWKVEANWIRDAKLTVQALTDEESDAMEVTVPVLPHGLEMIEATTAYVTNTGTKTVEMIIPEETDLNTATMDINVSPSITATLLSSMDDLIGYPYGCVEQTMSRFLPNVLVANTLNKVGSNAANIDREELEKMVDKGAQRLGELQHNDGGWGWWENDKTHPFMTAYVVNGLYLAKKAGYKIDDALYQNGLSALRTQITSKKGDETTTAYMHMVAASADLGLWKRPKKSEFKNAYETALWAQAASFAGDDEAARNFVDELLKTATGETGMTFWGGKKFYYSWQDDNVETTANALKAILMVDPDSKVVPGAVQWLMNQRKGNSWHNTRQTAMTIFALQDLIKQEMNPEFEIQIYANNALVHTASFNKSNFSEKGKTITLTGEDFTASQVGVGEGKAQLRVGSNKIRIVQKGKGRSYISSRLRYFLDGTHQMSEEQLKNQAFSVERKYYKLVEKKTEEGIVYVKTAADREEILPGDNILVKVKVTAKSQKEFVLIEDPIPGGCEFIRDPQGFIIEGEANYSSGGNYWDRGYWGYWNWNRWYSHQEYRDNKLAMTITNLPKGDYEYTYLMKAQIPGKYKLTPAVAQLMYYPEVRGFSNFEEFNIQDDSDH